MCEEHISVVVNEYMTLLDVLRRVFEVRPGNSSYCLYWLRCLSDKQYESPYDECHYLEYDYYEYDRLEVKGDTLVVYMICID
jgi:hypothetical protein